MDFMKRKQLCKCVISRMGLGGIVKFDSEDALRILDFLSTFTMTCNDSSILSRENGRAPVFSKLLEAKRIVPKKRVDPSKRGDFRGGLLFSRRYFVG
jgi:hypothetical protein